MCSLPIDGKAAASLHLLSEECVLLLQNVFSYYRMCSLPIDGKAAASLQLLSSGGAVEALLDRSVCVLLLQNVFSYYRMCSLAIECVLLL